MDDRMTDPGGKVVYLKPSHARAARLHALGGEAVDAGRSAGRRMGPLVAVVLALAWQPVRWVLCAVLVLFEPLLRIVLVPFAFLGFLATLVFGFAMDAPRFPKWGMLAFSVGALLLYWLYLAVMSLFMRLPRDRH
jgi:hypothetical protein